MVPAALDSMGFDTMTLDGMYQVDQNFYMILNATKVFEKELSVLV
jgi:hypothetical protein